MGGVVSSGDWEILRKILVKSFPSWDPGRRALEERLLGEGTGKGLDYRDLWPLGIWRG